MSDDKVLVSRNLLIDIAHGLRVTHERALAELRTLLAQPSDGALAIEGDKPVAWFDPSDMARLETGSMTSIPVSGSRRPYYQEPLYRHPPKVCTCPSGDGSLRWPCPVHPPEVNERYEFEKLYAPEALERDSDEYVRMAVQMAWEGWHRRACLDRVKELNS